MKMYFLNDISIEGKYHYMSTTHINVLVSNKQMFSQTKIDGCTVNECMVASFIGFLLHLLPVAALSLCPSQMSHFVKRFLISCPQI
jgi:hypothetical protein